MLYFLGALMRRKQVYDEFKSFFCVWQKDRLHICLIMQYNGNEIYATRYMKSLFLFGRRWIGYFRLYLTGVRYFCMRSMVSVSLPPCLVFLDVFTTVWEVTNSQKLYRIIRALISWRIPSYLLRPRSIRMPSVSWRSFTASTWRKSSILSWYQASRSQTSPSPWVVM